ncbi:PAS domain-containing protein [Chondrinema litorale]|uniref:PAS domain-containing protein n=1 Tax=Chondrinema litorale TaxID=2994555 RepID=UPI002543FA67|nr:PAS domain-containing protein [Chondrinema litorale]UZR98013.1 PAS domain-containing protein [Chondrinema litorale]
MSNPNKISIEDLPLSVLLENTLDRICILSQDGEYLFVNKKECEYLGSHKDDILNKGIWIINALFENKKDWTKTISKLREIINQTIIYSETDSYGNILEFKSKLQLIKYNFDEFVIITTKNIATKRNLESRLDEQSIKINELAQLPEEDPNPILKFSKAGKINYCNRAGKFTLYNFFKNSENGKRKIKEILENFLKYEEEIKINDSFYSTSYIPVNSQDGIVLYAKNITKLKKIEADLEKVSIVARQTSNGVVITNPEGKIEWVNNSFENVSGYKLEEIIGKKPSKFLQGEDTSIDSINKFKNGLLSKVHFNVEILNYSKQGKKYWCSCDITPILDKNGKVKNSSLYKQI